MKKTAILVALFPPIAALAADAAPASPHSLSANVTLASEYLYRGIAQTRGKPALQGGVDYAHASGFYLGAWGSTITWIDDQTAGASAPVEIDLYGGFQGAIAGGRSSPLRPRATSRPASLPARVPHTRHSSSEVLARRFAPCRPVQDTSPTARSRLMLDRPTESTAMPPQL